MARRELARLIPERARDRAGKLGEYLSRHGWGVTSGPRVARTFHRWVALIFVVAFLSLGAQVDVLFGSEGLSPLATRANAFPVGAPFLRAPSWLRWWSSDAALHAGVIVGVASGVLALAGVLPRLFIAVATLDYLGYVLLGAPFTSFQWDNMLVEVGFLTVFLPRRHRARVIHLLFVLLFIKLYLESGIAKWQSHLGDWHDGSAMTHYYETAPIPGWLAWQAHNLPVRWHLFESRLVLVLELVVPFLALGPRRAKLACLAALTGFQVVNLLTANYGFFVYLSMGLHLFLLEDRDIQRGWEWVRSKLRIVPGPTPPPEPDRSRLARNISTAVAGVLATYWIGFSLLSGLGTFSDRATLRRRARGLAHLYQQPRLVNDYHLFAHITRERIEPGFEVLEGQTWRRLALHHEPGPLDRPPSTVAPHQPRVDFQLWFYGLTWRRGVPRHVWQLLDALCRDDSPAHALFVDPPARRPTAVRLVYWRYWMTTREQRASTGHYWRREHVSTGRPIACPTS